MNALSIHHLKEKRIFDEFNTLSYGNCQKAGILKKQEDFFLNDLKKCGFIRW